jgi:hypothetical protein
MSTAKHQIQVLMLSSYLGGRNKRLALDNVTMKLAVLLCRLSSIYTLLDRQKGPKGQRAKGPTIVQTSGSELAV